MLANSADTSFQHGTLSKDLHFGMTSIHELIDFIAEELPRWRDHPDRPNKTSETDLTAQLCSYLNTAARYSAGWDMLQFKTEEPDERQKGRKIDLAVAPCGRVIWIEGRRCTQFETLLPIECKRLPTPKGTGRDEREYVINRNGSTGGIQRFKAGHHGAGHALAGMIAYVQTDSSANWRKRLSKWINDLDGSASHPGWSKKDQLQVDPTDCNSAVTIYRSSHTRAKALPNIEIRHLWIEMS